MDSKSKRNKLIMLALSLGFKTQRFVITKHKDSALLKLNKDNDSRIDRDICEEELLQHLENEANHLKYKGVVQIREWRTPVGYEHQEKGIEIVIKFKC